MSWIDDIVSLGSSALNFLGGNTIGSALARTAVTGLVLNQVAKSINKDNQVEEKGTRVQVDPDPDYRIPVVYGEAVVSGAVVDAQLTNGNTTMYYCLVLSEKTGRVALGAGGQSTFNILDVYWNDNRLVFGSNTTVSGYVDKSNNFCEDIAGKISVYFYDGNSTTPRAPSGYPVGSIGPAYNYMPNWTVNHNMTNLVFAIVRMDYDAEAKTTSLGNFRFKIRNSMSQPGDCLYDYMTNTRYGAGIDPAEIYAS